MWFTVFPVENEKKLQKNSDLKYCGKLCRSERLDKKDLDLESYILKRLSELKPSNICPSMVSKEYFNEEWKAHHQRVVKAARRLFLKDKILVTQKKKKIRDLNFKGPIRIQIK